jgi:hypothetical protein
VSSLLALASYFSLFNILVASVSRVLELFATKRVDLVQTTLLLNSLERYAFICTFILELNASMQHRIECRVSTCNHFRFTLLGDGMKSRMVLSIYKITAKIKLLSFTTSCWKDQRYYFINVNFMKKIFDLTSD